MVNRSYLRVVGGWKWRVIGKKFMDLSKAYACFPHDLLIAKLEAYGLDNNRLNHLLDYLRFNKQRTKVGSTKW